MFVISTSTFTCKRQIIFCIVRTHELSARCFPFRRYFRNRENVYILQELRHLRHNKMTQRKWSSAMRGSLEQSLLYAGKLFWSQTPNISSRTKLLAKAASMDWNQVVDVIWTKNRSKVRFFWIFASFKDCWCLGRLVCAYLKLMSPPSVRLAITGLANFPHKSAR